MLHHRVRTEHSPRNAPNPMSNVIAATCVVTASWTRRRVRIR
jgi:hypothetical protein